jgi:hypothetical protein
MHTNFDMSNARFNEALKQPYPGMPVAHRFVTGET